MKVAIYSAGQNSTTGYLRCKIGCVDHYTTPLSIALTGAAPDHQGVLHVTPNCMSLDELEGCINALQDELDVIGGEALPRLCQRHGGAGREDLQGRVRKPRRMGRGAPRERAERPCADKKGAAH